MSSVTAVLFAILSVTNAGVAQECALSGTAAWSDQLRYAIPSCDNFFLSPNGRFLLTVDKDGALRVTETASRRALRARPIEIAPPAMVSWAPRSNAFFINDGEGSGMASSFRLFRVEGRNFSEDLTVERMAVSTFRRQAQCAQSSADPNVWGIGWSPDGTRFYLLVQATTNSPCGAPDSFIGMIVALRGNSIVQQMSEDETKRRFRTMLPDGVFSK